MPHNKDFKRLVRQRMAATGERYTQAHMAFSADRSSIEPQIISGGTGIASAQLADTSLAQAAYRVLSALPEPTRRAAAVEGLSHPEWRVRRTCAQLLDKVDLTPEAIEALTRALDDPHPRVRRHAVHTLSCEHCKPDGCTPDVRPLFERVVHDPSSVVRSMVVHVCCLHFFDQQWAIDLVAGVAGADPSAKLRATAEDALRDVRERWESDSRRRQLAPELVRKTERHPRSWVAIRDGRIVAVNNGQGRVFRRELRAGAARYWVAPPGESHPRIP